MLLRLYPRAWRDRYEAEMLALLEEHDVTLATRFDLLLGALDAWQDSRRSLMAPLPTIARRAAGLGLIPSAFVITAFLFGLVADSRFLVNHFDLAALPAGFVVCLWAGMRAASAGSTWRDRLGSGLVAGAAAGLVAGALQCVVVIGLTLVQAAFALWAAPDPPIFVVAGQPRPASVVDIWAVVLSDDSFLLAKAAAAPTACIYGAAVGAMGAALNAILVGRAGRAGHPGQRPAAS